MILGSHNSMTYLRPRRWWMRLFRIFGRCQNKTIQQQFDSGVRCFDLRVSHTTNDGWSFSHGLIDYRLPADFTEAPDIPNPLNYPVHSVLSLLNSLATDSDPVYIRFILEKINHVYDPALFQGLCEAIQKMYRHLTFIGGVYKNTWQQLYDFHDPITEADIAQPIGSMAADARWYERIIPILSAHRTRKAPTPTARIVLKDFV